MPGKKKSFLIHAVIFYLSFVFCKSFRFKFDKVACNSTDEDYIKIEKCLLKAVSRNEQYISAYLKLYQKPIKLMKVNY